MAKNFRWLGKSNDGEQVVLQRFRGNFSAMAGKNEGWFSQNRARLAKAVVLDVETTGLSHAVDSIIEIGAREIYYDRNSGALEWVGKSMQGLQDPGMPLPPEITRLTGIQDSDLRGKSIDWRELEELLAGAKLILAHNAAFDRPFVEKKLASVRTVPWACSLTQIDWDSHGFSSKKLEILTIFHGFFSDAHRALGDVDALVELLSLPSPTTGQAYLLELLTMARKPVVHVIAANSPFESKDHLKGRGYSWDAERRVWHKKLLRESLDEEIRWMEEKIYRGSFRGIYEDIPLERNFA